MNNVQGKRYFVFAAEAGLTVGGWSDLLLATDDPEVAVARARDFHERNGGWAEVIDLAVSLPVWSKGSRLETP